MGKTTSFYKWVTNSNHEFDPPIQDINLNKTSSYKFELRIQAINSNWTWPKLSQTPSNLSSTQFQKRVKSSYSNSV